MRRKHAVQFTPDVLLDRFGGITRGTVLQGFGCSRDQLSAAVRAGTIRRVRPGVFALPWADPKVVTAALHGGALTCAEALRARGVWILPAPAEDIHVWMGGGGRTHPHPECACVVHGTAGRAELGFAPVAIALIHLYRCHDQETFFAAYESAWNKRLLPASARALIRRALPKSAGWLLDLARPDAESGLESLLRLRLHLLGIRLECQVVIAGVGRVDFVVGGRIILEADGDGNHSNEHRHRDLMRDAAAASLGYETLRFDYDMIVRQWEVVAEAILATLVRAAH